MTPANPMPVYRCAPKGVASKSMAALIVLQEVFGVNSQMKRVGERLAEQGYAAWVPDLFHRAGEHFTCGYDEMDRGVQRAQALDSGEFLEDMRELLRRIRGEQGTDVPIGVVGFCMGGRLAYLLACSEPLAAAVCYYGAGIAQGPIEKTPSLQGPVLLFFGAQDAYIPPSEIEEIRMALKAAQKEFELKVYPHAGHGFFCDERESYSRSAAEDSWKNMMDFLDEALKR